MKSVAECRKKFAKQWGNPNLRVERILGDGCPASLLIGKPKPRDMQESAITVRKHLEDWNGVEGGLVIWEPISYRATGKEVLVPTRWEVRSADQWVRAAGCKKIEAECLFLLELLDEVAEEFREFVVRRVSAFHALGREESRKVLEVAQTLEPGMACGVPLRALPVAGVDTKFFERNRALLVGLLDIRFSGVVSEMGLEAFLDAERDGSQWLLVVDLDGNLLPLRQIRVRSTDFRDQFCRADKVVVVENERCVHLLPEAPGTIAVLGAGLNLEWLGAAWLRDMELAYWGDLDSWGLTMLGRARGYVPKLQPLLMTREVVEAHADKMVEEPTTAGAEAPQGLSDDELALYHLLLIKEKGRLEQEFIQAEWVRSAVLGFCWRT